MNLEKAAGTREAVNREVYLQLPEIWFGTTGFPRVQKPHSSSSTITREGSGDSGTASEFLDAASRRQPSLVSCMTAPPVGYDPVIRSSPTQMVELSGEVATDY